MASSSIFAPMAATSLMNKSQRRTGILGPGRFGAALQGTMTALPSPFVAKDTGRMGGAVAFTSPGLPPPMLHGTPLRRGSERIKKASSNCTDVYRQSRVGGTGMVRASSIGEVQEVKQVSKEPLYYNVKLKVSQESEVAKWYINPGQYVNMILEESQYTSPSAFFIGSPLTIRARSEQEFLELEFLIQDVPNTVANEIINSKPGDRVVITTDTASTGFDMSALNNINESESVLMFASGYGLSPFRALIETGFEAPKRKHAILYAMYTDEQMPYKNLFPSWEQTGVEIKPGQVNAIINTNPTRTIVLMVASETEQTQLASYFEKKGVPEDNIITLFSGIPTSEKSYYNKVLHKLQYYPKFLHHAEKHTPVELKI